MGWSLGNPESASIKEQFLRAPGPVKPLRRRHQRSCKVYCVLSARGACADTFGATTGTSTARCAAITRLVNPRRGIKEMPRRARSKTLADASFSELAAVRS